MNTKPITTPKVSVVIPAFNEEDVIAETVARVLAVDPEFEVIVVDDGSSDKTADNAKQAGAAVIRHPYNIGNGASIKNGAKKSSGDIIIFLDGDGQHPPEQIPRLLEHMDEYEMVVGARTGQSTTSRFRNLGNWMLSAVACWITGQKIDDLTCGFRAIKRKPLMEYIHLFPKRYSYPTTITIAMFHGGHFVKYIPIDSITKRQTGTSGIRPARDFFKFIAIIFRIIVLFSPQRFFIPLGAFILLAGVVVSSLQLYFTGGIQSAGVVLLMSAVYIGCFGLLAEQIASQRRQKNE